MLGEVLWELGQKQSERKGHHGAPPAAVHVGVELKVEVGSVEVPECLSLDLGHGELSQFHQEGYAGEPDLQNMNKFDTVYVGRTTTDFKWCGGTYVYPILF